MRRWTDEPLETILMVLQDRLREVQRVVFEVLDPDLHRGVYVGSLVEVAGRAHRYRSLRAWVELAGVLGCRMLTPREVVGSPYLQITYERLALDGSFHDVAVSQREEKYGTASVFSQIQKMEEPDFFYYFHQALTNVSITRRTRILDLGINRGDEFAVIRSMVDTNKYQTMELIGIDHSESAIVTARSHFPEPNVHFYTHDINALEHLDLGRFDLLISIGTLQSPGIAFKPLLMDLVQRYLTRDSALILGFPNARWRDGELLYGAKAPNYTMSEMSLVLNDLMFAKRYLQQKRYRVTVTGRGYLFLTATKIGVGRE